MPGECANGNEEGQKRRITIDYLGSNEDQNVFHIGVRRKIFANGWLHGDQRCVRDNGHRTEHIEGIVPTADIRSDASERPLIDITVFESIGTKFKDVIHQCTDRHPWKDLVSSSIESSFPSSFTYRREQSHVSILFEDRQIISIGPVERGQRLRLFSRLH